VVAAVAYYNPWIAIVVCALGAVVAAVRPVDTTRYSQRSKWIGVAALLFFAAINYLLRHDL
jgi:hypothetical protein